MTPAVLTPPTRRHTPRLPPPPPRRPWDGGDGRPSEPAPEPRLLDNAHLGLLVFLGAETMLFASFVMAFFVLRTQAEVWPPPLQPRLPVAVTALNTLALLASSATMLAARRALGRGDRGRLLQGLAATAALGAVFLSVQGWEWARLLRFGLRASSGTYGGTFYTLIGLHGAHVAGALAWLSLVLAGVWTGRVGPLRKGPVTLCALYWHFVVAVWPALYVLVYLY
jgi:cytochrome c oxidase subunit III